MKYNFLLWKNSVKVPYVASLIKLEIPIFFCIFYIKNRILLLLFAESNYSN